MKKIEPHSAGIEIYRSGIVRRRWRWRITASNGEKIGASSEGYRKKSDCVYNLRSVGISIFESEFLGNNEKKVKK